MRNKGVRVLVAAVAAVLGLAACGGGSSGGGTASSAPAASQSGASGGGSGGAVKSGLKIAVLPKAINIPYFDAAYTGAKKACDEIKATCEQIGPTQATG